MWIRVFSEYFTGGCCGAVMPPMLDLAMVGKGSLCAIFPEDRYVYFCDSRFDVEDDV